MQPTSRTLALTLVWLSCAALPACAQGAGSAEQAEAPPAAQVSPEDEDLWSEVQTLYEKAKATGEKVPATTMEWIREDLDRIGDWEYRVVALKGDAKRIERELNALGGERWECFWVQTDAAGARFYLKRHSRSYLSTIPVTSLIKMLAVGGVGGDGE